MNANQRSWPQIGGRTSTLVGVLLTLSCGESHAPFDDLSGGESGQAQADAGAAAGTAASGGTAAGANGGSSGQAAAAAAGNETNEGGSQAGTSAGGQSPGASSGSGGTSGSGGDVGFDGGAGGEGNSGGWGGNCLVGVPDEGSAGAPALRVADAGDACADWGSLACAGANQKQNLVCTLGVWQPLEVCAANESCDQQTGRCKAIVADCVAHEPGFLYCEGEELKQCGVDRVSASASVCCGACSAGECRAPRCGDGVATAAEACDDGNRTSGDGCDADCQPSNVVQLVGGQQHSCALLREGRVRCWGGNGEGQLGLGDADDHSAQHPYELALVDLGKRATQLVTGSRHTCALLTDGDVRCWGANEYGQLGLGHTDVVGDDEVPDAQHAAVPLGAKVLRLSAGGESTCALLDGGALRCWGRNNFGQLGLGHKRTIGDNEIPSEANAQVDLAGHTGVAAGQSGEHLCVGVEDRSFLCWGDNTYQQLDYMRGWTVSGGQVVEILGSGWRTYTRLGNGLSGLFVAGFNLDGLLGSGGPSPASAPSDAAYLGGVFDTLQATAGPTHVCYIEANHTLLCFGNNERGALGFADNADRTFPGVVDLGADAQANPIWALQVGAGQAHTCAWLNTGQLRCWGKNESGQLGLGYASAAPLDYVGGSATDNAETAVAIRLFGPN